MDGYRTDRSFEIPSLLKRHADTQNGDSAAIKHPRNEGAAENMKVKLLVHQSYLGAMMGKGGARVQNVRNVTGVECKISKASDLYPGTENRIVHVNGSCDKMVEAVKLLLSPIERDSINLDIVIPDSISGAIIGKKGCNIIKMGEVPDIDKVLIQSPDKNEVPSERLISLVNGLKSAISEVFAFVLQILVDFYPKSINFVEDIAAGITSPVSSDKRPGLIMSDNRPSPLMSDNRLSSLMSDNRPSSLMSDNRPSSLMSDNRPSSLMSDNRPSSLMSDNRPSPLMSDNRPSPLMSGNHSGSRFNDSRSGNNFNDSLLGNKFNDSLLGNKFNDSFSGSKFNESFTSPPVTHKKSDEPYFNVKIPRDVETLILDGGLNKKASGDIGSALQILKFYGLIGHDKQNKISLTDLIYIIESADDSSQKSILL